MALNPNELLTVEKACSQYGVGRTSLYEALSSGALKAKKLGKRATRIRRADMDAWIDSLTAYKPSSGA